MATDLQTVLAYECGTEVADSKLKALREQLDNLAIRETRVFVGLLKTVMNTLAGIANRRPVVTRSTRKRFMDEGSRGLAKAIVDSVALMPGGQKVLKGCRKCPK